MSLWLDSQATQLPKSVSYFLPNPEYKTKKVA